MVNDKQENTKNMKRYEDLRVSGNFIIFINIGNVTCFITKWPTSPCGPLFTPKRVHYLHNNMAPPHRINSPQKEGRMALALHSLSKKQFKSQRKAAKVYVVPRSTMQTRIKGVQPKRESRAPNRLLL